MINIKNLYIGEIGKFKGYVYPDGRALIDYDKLKGVSFYLKKDDYYYDIFYNQKYQVLNAIESIPENGIGLVEPKKYNEYFSDAICDMIDENPMFSLDELKEIKQKMAQGPVFGGIKINQIINEKQDEFEM
ncbi:MAG: hypothetical protein ACI4TT_03380 [Christensenellales bacterium]